jgi:hypothetical protein
MDLGHALQAVEEGGDDPPEVAEDPARLLARCVAGEVSAVCSRAVEEKRRPAAAREQVDVDLALG